MVGLIGFGAIFLPFSFVEKETREYNTLANNSQNTLTKCMNKLTKKRGTEIAQDFPPVFAVII